MKSFFRIAGALAVGVGLSAAPAWGTYSLTSPFYSQNFDGMGSGTTAPTGWFVGTLSPQATNGAIASAAIFVDDGGSSTARHYNYGTISNIDRALGSLAASGATRVTEFRFKNDTGFTLLALTLLYTGEQWRTGQTANQLTLHYGANSNALLNAGSSFTFTAPQIKTGTGSALNGNASTNRVTGLGGTITGLSISNGTTFILRWIDLDSDNTDAGIALDDFTLTAITDVIPEPSTLMLCSVGLLGLLAYLRRRR